MGARLSYAKVAPGHAYRAVRGLRGSKGENRVMQEVRHQPVMLPYYRILDDAAYRVNWQYSDLLGEVTNPTLKSDAGNVVKSIEGVTQANNEIEVLQLSPMDWQIRRAEVHAIYSDPRIGDAYGNRALPSIHNREERSRKAGRRGGEPGRQGLHQCKG